MYVVLFTCIYIYTSEGGYVLVIKDTDLAVTGMSECD